MRRFTVPLLATLLLAACNSTPTSTPAPSSATQPALAGQWQLTEINGQALNMPEAVIQFDSEKLAVSASVGCNRLFGRYHLHEGLLTLSAPASTLMACASTEVSQLEQQLSHALQAVNGGSYRIENDVLLLQDSDGKPVLKAQRQTRP